MGGYVQNVGIGGRIIILICKSAEYKNGYIFTPTSTNRDLQEIFKKYDEVRCVICNSKTARNFKVSSWGYSTITINNRISDGCFFINGAF